MKEYAHAHPIDILLSVSRFLGLLIFPVLRAIYSLLFTTNLLIDWLRGTWFDLLIILLIIGLGFIRWQRRGYRLEESGIRWKRGIFFVQTQLIPYEKLSVVAKERLFYLMPLRAVYVSADTDGGDAHSSDFSMLLKKKEADPLVEKCRALRDQPQKIERVYLPKNRNIAILSLIASNSLGGVLFLSTLFSGAGKVLGRNIEREVFDQLTTVTGWLLQGIPPVAAMVGLLILGGWCMSFLVNLIRHLRFSAARRGNWLRIESGLISRRLYDITVSRINLVEMQQNVFTKALGLYSVFLHANGYGKKKDELSVLMPSCDREEFQNNLRLLLPEFSLCRATVKPRVRYLSRFLIPPAAWIGGVSLFWWIVWRLVPDLHSTLLFLWLMSEVPCVWYLIVKIVSFFHTGIGVKNGVYTLRYTFLYRFKTVIVPRERIVSIQVKRSCMQFISGCCDVVIDTFSEGKKRHVIPNIPLYEAQQILKCTDLPEPILLRKEKRNRKKPSSAS